MFVAFFSSVFSSAEQSISFIVILVFFALLLFSVTLGFLGVAPAYFAGRFIRRQVLDHGCYRLRDSQFFVVGFSTPAVAFLAFLLGSAVGLGFESTVTFSVLWGFGLGFASLESFADLPTRLPRSS